MDNETTRFPTGVQIAKDKRDFNSALQQAIEQMNLRFKSFELASQFPTDDPLKLAREIFEFITERDDAA